MSTFKHNKGKLVEQPTMEHPGEQNYTNRDGCFSRDYFNMAVDDYRKHLASLRTYDAEGFAEDELVEEKDLELQHQGERLDGLWADVTPDHYEQIHTDGRRRIIARRKVTKEEGEKSEANIEVVKRLISDMENKSFREEIIFWEIKKYLDNPALLNKVYNLT